MAFPGIKGSAIYLRNYLYAMFQISDVLIDKDAVAMVFNIKISLQAKGNTTEVRTVLEPGVCVSEELSSASKSHMESIVRKMAEILDSHGVF